MAAARYSDWKQLRGPVVCAFCIASVIGYALLISDMSSGVHYFGCFLVALGLYVSVGIPLAWLPSNNPRYGKRTTATGLQLTIGNSSGIMASFVRFFPLIPLKFGRLLIALPQLYPDSEGPRFVRGHAVTMALVALGCVIYAYMHLHFGRENTKRERGLRDEKMRGLEEDEILALGDENPRYRFTI